MEPTPNASPRNEAAHGIVLVDKPSGSSSNAVTRTVQRLFGARSAGHLGTLDPFATGLLVVLLGDATRLAPWLEQERKSYVARVVLGVTTDTLDREGTVVATRPVPPDARERLLAALPRFTGTLRQRVPEFSAAKVRGVRRADLARRGVSVEPKFKDVTVYSLSLADQVRFPAAPRPALSPVEAPAAPALARSTARSLELSIACGPGTYVRQLVADLGEELGCGAHTGELRRMGVGTFAVEHAVTLERIESIPWEIRPSLMSGIGGHLPGPMWPAGAAEWSAFERGQAIAWEPRLSGAPGVCFVVVAGAVRGVGEIRDGRLQPRRVLARGVSVQAPGGDRSREIST